MLQAGGLEMQPKRRRVHGRHRNGVQYHVVRFDAE
jgi:hypothetical protein